MFACHIPNIPLEDCVCCNAIQKRRPSRERILPPWDGRLCPNILYIIRIRKGNVNSKGSKTAGENIFKKLKTGVDICQIRAITKHLAEVNSQSEREYADVAELADALDSGSSGSDTVGVQVPSSAPLRIFNRVLLPQKGHKIHSIFMLSSSVLGFLLFLPYGKLAVFLRLFLLTALGFPFQLTLLMLEFQRLLRLCSNAFILQLALNFALHTFGIDFSLHGYFGLDWANSSAKTHRPHNLWVLSQK